MTNDLVKWLRHVKTRYAAARAAHGSQEVFALGVLLGFESGTLEPPATLRTRVLRSLHPGGRRGRMAKEVLEDVRRSAPSTAKGEVAKMLSILVRENVIRTRGRRGAFHYVMAFASAGTV